jgi:surface antigen
MQTRRLAAILGLALPLGACAGSVGLDFGNNDLDPSLQAALADLQPAAAGPLPALPSAASGSAIPALPALAAQPAAKPAGIPGLPAAEPAATRPSAQPAVLRDIPGDSGVLAVYADSGLGDGIAPADHRFAEQTAQRILEFRRSGTAGTWRNPENDHSGKLTPQRTYLRADGTYCREYEQVLHIGDRAETAYGTACRVGDGLWLYVE